MANDKVLNPSISLPVGNPLNMQGQQVFNVAQPTDMDDVVTLRYFNENASPSQPDTTSYHEDFTATAGTTFDLTGTGIPATLERFVLSLDGITLVTGEDYTYTSPTITFTRALKAGSFIEVWAIGGAAGERGLQGPANQGDFRWDPATTYSVGNLVTNQFPGSNADGTVVVAEDAIVPAPPTPTSERFRLNLAGVSSATADDTSPTSPYDLSPLSTARFSYVIDTASPDSHPFNTDFSIGVNFNSTGGISFSNVRYGPGLFLGPTFSAEDAALRLNQNIEDGIVSSGSSTQFYELTNFSFAATGNDVGGSRNVTMSFDLEITTTVADAGLNIEATRVVFGNQFVEIEILPPNITLSRVQTTATSLRIQSMNPSIDETITFDGGLTDAALEADFVTKFNANATLQAEFLPASIVDDQVQFDHRGTVDIMVMFSITQGDGSITLTETVTEGTDGSFIIPILQLRGGNPFFTDIVLASGDTPQLISDAITFAINSNSRFTATENADNDRQTDWTGVASEFGFPGAGPTSVIVRIQGSSSLTNAQFVLTTVNPLVSSENNMNLYTAIQENTNVEPTRLSTPAQWVRLTNNQ